MKWQNASNMNKPFNSDGIKFNQPFRMRNRCSISHTRLPPIPAIDISLAFCRMIQLNDCCCCDRHEEGTVRKVTIGIPFVGAPTHVHTYTHTLQWTVSGSHHRITVIGLKVIRSEVGSYGFDWFSSIGSIFFFLIGRYYIMFCCGISSYKMRIKWYLRWLWFQIV